MAIIKSCAKLIIEQSQTYQYSGKALTLGVPEVYATYDELKKWFPSLAKKSFPLPDAAVKFTSHEAGGKLGWVSAETFLRSLGFSEIMSVDIPGSEYDPDFIHDLNLPLPDDMVDQFDLVIDPGTTEHVFDIKTALWNVVRSLKIGGTIIHQVPVYSYNGGYYSINPNVLNDFYAANGFDELKTYIVLWDRYRAYFGKHLCYEYSEDVLGARHALADYDQCRYSPQMLFFARKRIHATELKIPIQFSSGYLEGMANKNDVDISFFKKIKSMAYGFLPYQTAYYLNIFTRRLLFLIQTRRKSFWV